MVADEEVQPDSNNAASAALVGSQTTFFMYFILFLVTYIKICVRENWIHSEIALLKSFTSKWAE